MQAHGLSDADCLVCPRNFLELPVGEGAFIAGRLSP
jgi:hypothetical protein